MRRRGVELLVRGRLCTPFRGAQRVETDVGGDAADPNSKVIASVESWKSAIYAHERLLGGVLRVLRVPKHAVTDGAHLGRVARIDRVEYAFIACLERKC
jgi:hypothetical protein